MKICPKCDQPVALEVNTCPLCGSEIGQGRTRIDDYHIEKVLHEGYASILCKATREKTGEPVMIRIFTPRSGVEGEVAERLKRELLKLKQLPDNGFVRHHAIRYSDDKTWYRISEWIESISWGSLLASGRLNDLSVLLDLFYQMASILNVLHEDGYTIPHLILNDIIVYENPAGALQIKIDYKLSRFFDPKLDQPGPMLKKLIGCHPDITGRRPLDVRSDIWALGKIFIELLSADLECTDFLTAVDHLELPHDLEVLLKVMLAEDPDMRPRSMQEVAESLKRIQAEAVIPLPASPAAARETPLWKMMLRQRRIIWSAVLILILFMVGFVVWFQFSGSKKDITSVLEGYANKYARSVAFVLVEYWISADDKKVYRNVSEGSAFLVDRSGYLLTSRHVACPWLEDGRLLGIIQRLRQYDKTPRFGYRIYLWFEGARAFNRAAAVIKDADLEDLYFTESAYSTDADPHLTIAGVAKPPTRTRQVITAPLRNDFAVLRVEPPPADLEPLPLDVNMDPQKVPKLSRVLALGFPLGRRTQDTTVNVSVTSGHVRRTFETLLQIDASLHGGNSGGPIIDKKGRVIGIATGVALDRSQGMIPTATPLWDMGLILPINKAVVFLEALKAGQIKWNGVLDLSAGETLEKINQTAQKRRWAEAMQLADTALEASSQPELYMAAGIMHFCADDLEGAKKHFAQAVSMDEENSQAKLMLYIIDWLKGKPVPPAWREDLLESDWDSPAEFEGYLVRVVEGRVDAAAAAGGWYNASEKSRIHYVLGLKAEKQQDRAEAAGLMRSALLAADPEDWTFSLARARLEQIQKAQRKALQTEAERERFESGVAAFEAQLKTQREEAAAREERQKGLIVEISRDTGGMAEKIVLLGKLAELDPENRLLLAAQAFYHTALGNWPEALEMVRKFRDIGGRESAERMSLGLLEAGILRYQKQDTQVQQILEAYTQSTRDDWYLTICEYLLGKRNEVFVSQQAGESPEKLLTGNAVMGFWAEAGGDKPKAMKFYKEALESFLDTWLEYDFVRQRLAKLRE